MLTSTYMYTYMIDTFTVCNFESGRNEVQSEERVAEVQDVSRWETRLVYRGSYVDVIVRSEMWKT